MSKLAEFRTFKGTQKKPNYVKQVESLKKQEQVQGLQKRKEQEQAVLNAPLVTKLPTTPIAQKPILAPVLPTVVAKASQEQGLKTLATQKKAELNQITPQEQRELEANNFTPREQQIVMGIVKGSKEERDTVNLKIAKNKEASPYVAAAQNFFEGASMGLSNLALSEEERKEVDRASSENKAIAIGSNIAGSLIPQGILYKAVNKALAGTKLASVSGGLKGFGASQGTQLVADAIVQTPIEVIRAIEEDKTVDEAGKDWLVNRGLDAIINLGMGTIENLPKLKQFISTPRGQKALADKGIDPTTLNQAIDSGDVKAVQDIIYVNQYGVASKEPFEQLQLPSPKKMDDFRNWRSEASGNRLNTINNPVNPAKEIKSEIPISERTFKEIGNQKIKAFQYENPEVKPFYKEKANELLLDLKATTKGEKSYTWEDGDLFVGGIPRNTSPMMAEIKDSTGATYEQIEDALNRIINDAGQENQALAKRIEVIIDEMLVDGYKRIDGEIINPNIRYIQTRNRIDPNKIEIEALAGQKASQLNNQMVIGLDDQKSIFDVDSDFDDFIDFTTGIKPKKTELKPKTMPTIERPSEFTVRQPQYPPLAKDFTTERPFTVTPSEVSKVEQFKQFKAQNPVEQSAIRVEEPQVSMPTQTVRTMSENTGLGSAGDSIQSGIIKERGFSENIRTDANRVDEVRKSFDSNPEFYEVLSNKDTLQTAQERFAKGFDNALEDFERTKNQLRADNVPLAKLLADDAASRGDMQTARRIIVDIAETLTTAGQFSQAAKILRESNDPVTVLRFVQKEIDRLNDVGGKRYGKKWNKIDLTDEELNLVNGIGKNATDEQKEQLFNQLFDSVSKRIPTTRREQFDAWRRIAMLFNPKTHVRNIAGNTLMYGIKKLSNEVAMTGEKLILPKDQLTKGRVTKELKQVANDVFEKNKKSLLEGSRWEVLGVKSPFADKPIFKSGWLNTLDDISKRTLEAEDVMFFKKNFTDDLAGFMNARGLKEPTQEAIDYATRRAQESTFRQANKLAEAINKMKGSRYGLLVDAAIPFTKTPANILTTGIDYSPIGAIKGAISLVNNADPKLAIETLSKGLTGSALSLVGYYMAMNGLARGDYEKDKDVEGLYQATGQLPNSIKMGNGSYTVDWAQPLSIPFFMGVAFAESMKKDSDDKAQAVFDALVAGGETLIKQSMLQGVSDLFGGYGTTTEKIIKLPIDYMTQGFPTAFGQISRTIDPTKRQADYSTLLSGTFTGLQAKTPFASQLLPEKRGILGETQKYGKGLLNAFQQFLSPGYIGTPSDNPLVQEIDRLYNEVGSDFLPKYNVTSFQSLGEQYKLTGEERSELQRIMGEYTNQQLTKIINTTTYQNATDEQKAEMIKTANETGYKLAKQAIVEARSKK